MRLLAITINIVALVVLIAAFRPGDIGVVDFWNWVLIALMFAVPVINLIALLRHKKA